MWKPTQQTALWFHGGNLHQSRHYSQFLALQLKARMEGIAGEVYGLPEIEAHGDFFRQLWETADIQNICTLRDQLQGMFHRLFWIQE
jgi:hypothetical protein